MKHLSYRLGSLSALVSLGLAPLAPAALHAAGPGKRNPKISVDAASSQPSELVPVIIQYLADPGQDQDDRIAALGGTADKHLHSIHAVRAHLASSMLEQLAADSNVAYVSLDRTLGARQVQVLTAEYTTEPINANYVWPYGVNGAGVGVAVIDSGINVVDDLSTTTCKGPKCTTTNRVVYNANFVPNESTYADNYGHGTHVAGLIGGNAADSTGPNFTRTFSGVAPGVNLINLRALDENGNGSDSSVIAALEAAISLQKKYNIRVINLSLGRPIWESYTLDPLCQAVEQAWKAGIVVVVAAGNQGRNQSFNPEGYGTIEAPGNDPYALTVGAMKTMGTPQISDDLIATYSSKGPTFVDHIAKPDLVAPGNLVTSLKFTGDSLALNNPSFVTLDSFYIKNGDSNPSPNYFPLSGTSMAAGVTSGAVALMLQAFPNLTPRPRPKPT